MKINEPLEGKKETGFNKAVALFDRAISKGAEIFLVVERLNDKEEEERRLSVCESGAGICYDKARKKCMLCGCFMEKKVKMLRHKNPKKNFRIEITACPEARWGMALSPEDYEKEKKIINYYRELDGIKLL